eukprot:jgi/Botrbrau1/9458/Bobra.0252s0079.1
MSLSAFIYSTVSSPCLLVPASLATFANSQHAVSRNDRVLTIFQMRSCALRTDAGPGQALECMSEFGSIPNSEFMPPLISSEKTTMGRLVHTWAL